ncbi:endospore germination permease [Vallitalea pronyensis]|uniref:Endospore germination permease n=1 Tax=Vallitalea pronyensis TaxID=1348613 RepID=A0A8J8MK50_9FIRM|nr:endospore germination permease [Vallitalea pronyensis]QUI23312.1 endospore germination permease [Vallitalea pronyensis]
MKSNANNTATLTPSEMTHFIIAMVIGVGILGGTGTIENAGNDGWIAILIGGLYPLYMIWLAFIISKRYPKDTIISINSKLFGKYLGFVCSIFVCGVFMYILLVVVSAFASITRTFIAPFLPIYTIIGISMFLIFYFASKGMKVIAKVNAVIFYLTLILILLPGYAFIKGSYFNLLPVFNSSLSDILTGSFQSIYSYAGIEVVFLLYPFASDQKKLFGSMLKGVGIVVAIYVWLTVTVIYYLGADVAIKFYWPLLTIADSVQVPIINLFRYIFMLFWSFIIYRISANALYFSAFTLTEFLQIKKKEYHTIILGAIAVLVGVAMLLIDNESIRREITKKEPYIAIVFTVYITILTLLVVLLKKKPSENSDKKNGG